MNKVRLAEGSCTRYYSKFSSCTLCHDICPTEAVECKESEVKISQDDCISCGACVGVCPNEALELTNFNVTDFFFDFLKSDEDVISCKTNFVCLAGLNVEYLMTFGLVKSVTLDTGYCSECDIKDSCFPQIEKNIEEANRLLKSFGFKEIKAEEIKAKKEEKTNRREFFNIFSMKNIAKTKRNFDESLEENSGISSEIIRAIKEKTLPNKRKILFTILNKIGKVKEYELFSADEISFTSSKYIDESCDNCSICYRVCPTSALSTNTKMSKIYFDDLMCIKCRLCHDVCEKESISLTSFDTKEFFEATQKELISFDIVRCNECGAFFTYKGGEKMCQRCKQEEEGALELWGLN